MKSLRRCLMIISDIIALGFSGLAVCVSTGIVDYKIKYMFIFALLSIVFVTLGTIIWHSYLCSRRDKNRCCRFLFRELFIAYFVLFVLVMFFDGIINKGEFSIASSVSLLKDRITDKNNFDITKKIINDFKNITEKTSLSNICVYLIGYIPLGFLACLSFKSIRKKYVYITLSVILMALIYGISCFLGNGTIHIDYICLGFIGLIIGMIISKVPFIKKRVQKTNYKKY